MKKVFILLLLMASVITADAQNLSVKQVIEKAFSAMNTKKHSIKGNVTTKTMGLSVTLYCASDGVNSYTSGLNGGLIIYNNKGVQYEYKKKKNTVTITNSEFSDPFFGDMMGDVSQEDFSDAQMEYKNGEYSISAKEDGVKITLVIDGKTFFFKSIKMKKLLMSFEMKYSNLAYFTNNESLVYQASKFPNAKIVDKRKKK